MPRRSKGPHLVTLKKKGFTQSVYYIRWTEKGRTRERTTGETDLGRAEEAFSDWLIEQRQAARDGRPGHPSEVGVADVLNAYAIEHAPDTAAPERIAYAMDALLTWWQDSMVEAIRTETCKRYRQERGVGDGTIRRELGVLRAAVRHAVRAGRLTIAPEFWMPPPPPARDRWLQRDEAAALLRAARSSDKAKHYLPLFILIALYTGARKEAVLSLRWTQVDLVRGRIDFNPKGRRQTKKRRPIIPIPNGLAWFLKKEHARASSPFVIHRNGVRLGDVKKAFKAACRRIGLEDVTPHTLRHTAGTWMAQQGVDLWQIGGYLGQDYERTTELYAHHHPDFLNDAKRAMD